MDEGRSLLLLGGGGHASDVLAAAEANGYTESDLTVCAAEVTRPERFTGRARVLIAPFDEAVREATEVLSAVGYPHGRAGVLAALADQEVRWRDALVHPHASVHHEAALDLDVVVLGQTWISAGVTIGAHTNVGYGATVGHDVRIGENCSVMPGAGVSGDVEILDDVLVGAGATILQGRVVGRGAVVGAGAVVTSDVPPDTVVVGVPARPTGDPTELVGRLED